jgi:hypothetical protein
MLQKLSELPLWRKAAATAQTFLGKPFRYEGSGRFLEDLEHQCVSQIDWQRGKVAAVAFVAPSRLAHRPASRAGAELESVEAQSDAWELKRCLNWSFGDAVDAVLRDAWTTRGRPSRRCQCWHIPLAAVCMTDGRSPREENLLLG